MKKLPVFSKVSYYFLNTGCICFFPLCCCCCFFHFVVLDFVTTDQLYQFLLRQKEYMELHRARLNQSSKNEKKYLLEIKKKLFLYFKNPLLKKSFHFLIFLQMELSSSNIKKTSYICPKGNFYHISVNRNPEKIPCIPRNGNTKKFAIFQRLTF